MECPFGAPDWVCDGYELCFRCATIVHARKHPESVDGCRECKLATVQLSPSCKGEARNNIAPKGTAGGNSWEKGIATDERGLPYRDYATGAPISLKRFAANRSRYEESRRAIRNGALQETRV